MCAHTVTAATPCAARSCERWRPQPQSDSPGLGLGSRRGWFGYNLAAFGECLLGQRFSGFHLSHAVVTLRSGGETTNASFWCCGMLSVGLGCQQEAAPLLLWSLQGKRLGKTGLACMAAAGQSCLGDVSQQGRAKSTGKRRRDSAEGIECEHRPQKPPSRREENGREICKARGNEALQRGMTSAKCSEEKQLGKEDRSYRCVSDGSKTIQLGSSSNGRLFIGAHALFHDSSSSDTLF